MHTAFVILALIACACAASFEDDIFAGNDPKDNYFRYVRTYSQGDYDESARGDVTSGLPQPYGFRIYYPKHTKRAMRTRRAQSAEDSESVSVSTVVPSTDDKLLDIDEALKPLELDVLEADADNSTSTETSAGTTGADEVAQNDLVINDFIRFKRNAEPERSAKMLLSDGKPLDTNREPRGVVQEKWVKQPYQVQVDERERERGRSFDDVDPPNAPRVHFVTQRRSESAPPLVYHSYEAREREGRSRELTRQRDIDLERDLEPGYYPRPARHYGSQLGGGGGVGGVGGVAGGGGHDSFIPRRPEMYYRSYDRDSRDRDFRDDRDLRGRDYERDRDRDFERGRRYFAPQDRDRDRYYEEDRPIPSIAKQKRIIYYATLPDIHQVRPQGLDRDRDRDRDGNFRRGYYDDRDRDRDPIRDNRVPPSDDRYSSQPLAINSGAINYRFRNGNSNGNGNESPYDTRDTPGDKSRYDEAATAKSGTYPTKVASPDVNVRTLKKNPERRVYSEVGRRYPPGGSGYQHDDGPTAYDSNHR